MAVLKIHEAIQRTCRATPAQNDQIASCHNRLIIEAEMPRTGHTTAAKKAKKAEMTKHIDGGFLARILNTKAIPPPAMIDPAEGLASPRLKEDIA